MTKMDRNHTNTYYAGPFSNRDKAQNRLEDYCAAGLIHANDLPKVSKLQGGYCILVDVSPIE